MWYMVIGMVTMALLSTIMVYLNRSEYKRRAEFSPDELEHHHLTEPPAAYRLVEPPNFYDQDQEGW